MTTQELIDSVIDEAWYRDNSQKIKSILDEFFSQNVVIPKGGTLQYKNDNDEYIDVFHESSRDISRYRIKPQEEYEYQWTFMSNGIRLFTDYLTDEEFKSSPLQYDYWDKLEVSKRLRQ